MDRSFFILKEVMKILVRYMDYTSPSAQFTFDVNKSPLFKKDNQNYINILGVNQLNTLENVSLFRHFPYCE